jgi:hypothetical protein
MQTGSIVLLAALARFAAGLHGQTFDNGAQVFNVKATYGGLPGALGNDTGDDGPAIQRAIDSAMAAHGGIVFLPAGTYRLGSGLSLSGGVILEGSGWNRDPNHPVGTWLHVTSTAFIPIAISFDGSGVRGLAIAHDQPPVRPGWTPNLGYPYAIQLHGVRPGTGAPYGAFIRDVLLLNPTRGVLQAGENGAAGLLEVSRLYGQPLLRGFEIQNMQDVLHVNGLHFGPVWSTDPNVFSYTRANGIGIVSYRDDEPVFQDIFLFEYLTGFQFSSNSAGVTGGFHISNYHCDACHEGIRIWQASGTRGAVSNVDIANLRIPGSTGVHVVDSHDAILLLENLHVLASGGANIQVERSNAPGGNNPVVMVDNLIADGWDTDNQGRAALAAGPGCNIRAGFNRLFIAPNNGVPTAGAVALGQ